MKRSGLIILAILAILVIWGISVRNGLATKQVDLNGKWGQVENQYQRKLKLYDDEIQIIKGGAKNEDTTLIKIVQMRSKIPSNIDQNNPQAVAAANQQFDQLKSSINISVEAYPTLQTPQQFRAFQTEAEGTENRITTAIMDWNNAITAYNNQIVQFPTNLLAGLFGYTAKSNFKSDEGAKDTKIDFSK